MKEISPLLYPLLATTILFRQEKPATPAWSMTPHSEVSHFALRVAALWRGTDDLAALADGPSQVIRVPLPSLLNKPRGDAHQHQIDGAAHDAVGALAAFTTNAALEIQRDARAIQTTEIVEERLPQRPEEIAPPRDMLRKHFDAALTDLSALRGAEVAQGRYAQQTHDCVFEAGLRAIFDSAVGILWETSPFCEWMDEHPVLSLPDMYVVHTGPGSGKTTAAKAFMVALVRATEGSRHPLGCVLLVHHVETAALAYQELNALMPGRVRVWTKEHDLERGHREPRCAPEDLQDFPLMIVTHAFYQGVRGDLARSYRANGTVLPRALTFVDEKVNEVETYAASHRDVAGVDTNVKRNDATKELDEATEELVQFIVNKRHGPDLETPTQDPEGWRVAERLSWFTTEEAARYQRSQGARWTTIAFEDVFGFARGVANHRAFIARTNHGKRGTSFVGYDPAPPQAFGMVLLDATADIDGVNEFCSWRKPVKGPAERYDNLAIVHEPTIVSGTFKKWWEKSKQNQIDYVAHIEKLIMHNVEQGQRALVVCMRDVVFCPDLDGWSKYVRCFADRATTDFVWNLDDRRVAVTWWGGYGIGANDWRDADVVLLFDDYHLPRHILIATLQGLNNTKATKGVLATLAAHKIKRTPILTRLAQGTSCGGSSNLRYEGEHASSATRAFVDDRNSWW